MPSSRDGTSRGVVVGMAAVFSAAAVCQEHGCMVDDGMMLYSASFSVLLSYMRVRTQMASSSKNLDITSRTGSRSRPKLTIQLTPPQPYARIFISRCPSEYIVLPQSKEETGGQAA